MTDLAHVTKIIVTPTEELPGFSPLTSEHHVGIVSDSDHLIAARFICSMLIGWRVLALSSESPRW